MFRRVATRRCPAASSSGIVIPQSYSTAISKDPNPFVEACLKTPTSILRIKNRLDVPSGPRQPVGLKPLPPARVPAAPQLPDSDSPFAGITLEAALAQLVGDSERASSRSLARLWGDNAFPVDDAAGDTQTAKKSRLAAAADVSARQQVLDVDSLSLADESAPASATPDANSSASGLSFNGVSRDCVSRATFLGTVVHVSTLASPSTASNSSATAAADVAACEIVLLCEEDDGAAAVLVCAHVPGRIASRPSVAAQGGLRVGARVLLSGALRMQRTAVDAALSVFRPPPGGRVCSNAASTLPLISCVTSVAVVGSAVPRTADDAAREQFASELLDKVVVH